MKLRIFGDSIRLRLSKTEVERMRSHGRVEAVVHFGPAPEQALRYVLLCDRHADVMRASFEGGVVEVRVPAADLERWTTTEEVGMRVTQPIDEARCLDILVEKDFKCLQPRSGEEAYDGFPNPKATC